MSRDGWPLSIVTGFLGSGKTTLITRLLQRPDMADTVVIVNEFGEIGLDHHLIRRVTDNVVLLPNGCLCCSVRQDVVQTLRELHRSWLAGEVPDFARVVVETTGLAEPSPLLSSLLGHPVLADTFALRAVVTVIDAEYGPLHLAQHPTCWQQACVADHLVISKCDLTGRDEIMALRQNLTTINPLASLWQIPANLTPDFLFERMAERPTRSAFSCVPAPDHLARINTVVLKPDGPLSWRKFQVWLKELLDRIGPDLLRLKGCLRFDHVPGQMIIQAVHQTFYPIVESPSHIVGGEYLVLIFDGQPPTAMERDFAGCRAG